MTASKKTIIIAILLFCFLSILIYKEMGKATFGGGCEYKKFTDTVKVEKITFISDTIDYINLKSTSNSNYIYQMNAWELSFRIGKDFSEKQIKDTLNSFYITGESITKGSCVPYSIDEMKLIKKIKNLNQLF